MTTLSLDYETRSLVDLKTAGLDRYSLHDSTRIMLMSYAFDNDETALWDWSTGEPFPKEVKKALASKDVIKRAFNAQFERIMTKRVLGVDTPYENWRCTMVQAYLMSFMGGLDDVGRQMGLPQDKLKLKTGKDLIRLFCVPNRQSKAKPYLWCDVTTHPEQWHEFGGYCIRDTDSERDMAKKLDRYFIPEDEWRLYELDQKINDRGLPLNMRFVENANEMAIRRKNELKNDLNDLTGLANANSTAQFIPWLRQRGYPFSDVKKDTVAKVLKGAKNNEYQIDPLAIEALNIRRNASRTSVAKYQTMLRSWTPSEHPDFALARFMLQMAGASRTARWGGRRIQMQNLARTPKELEAEYLLELATEMIVKGDYDGLGLLIGEQMVALVGCLRSAFYVPPGRKMNAADLSSIETCVVAWLADCTRLLKVIRDGKDPYKDFAVILFHDVYADYGTPEYNEAYEKVSKKERTDSKPAVLGSCYRLGGGDLVEGKRTGLWGYAESMGVDLTWARSHKATNAYRETYVEIKDLWTRYEKAIACTIRTRKPTRVGPIQFSYEKPFLKARLPSGRYMYYFQPRVENRTFQKQKRDEDGSPMVDFAGRPIMDTWTKETISYMGKNQATNKWERIHSHGGKFLENFTQAFARDILKYGLFDADDDGFYIIGHVHDEILDEEDEDDDYHTYERLGQHMTRARDFAPGLPLGFGGWTGKFFRKD